MKLSELKPNPNNPRKISKEGLEKLKKSIKGFERMLSIRPIIIDEKNIILGGNQRFAALKSLGYKDIPNEWVKQEMDLTEEQKEEFIIKDNLEAGEWEVTLLQNWNLDKLDEWGLDLPELENDIIKSENNYSKTIEAPKYLPSGECPEIETLFNTEKHDKLIQEIEESGISKEQKDFLKKCATRHIVFSYSKIADFYSHANKELQELMEKSALVIIDFEKAIENGYVALSKNIEDTFSKEYPDEK